MGEMHNSKVTAGDPPALASLAASESAPRFGPVLSDALFDELSSEIKGTVYRKGDPNFNTRSRLWNGNLVCESLAVGMPLDAEDVSKIVLFCRKHSFSPSVKAGGYGTAGWAAAGDIMIDLAYLAAIDIEPPTNGPVEEVTEKKDYTSLRNIPTSKGKAPLERLDSSAGLKRQREAEADNVQRLSTDDASTAMASFLAGPPLRRDSAYGAPRLAPTSIQPVEPGTRASGGYPFVTSGGQNRSPPTNRRKLEAGAEPDIGDPSGANCGMGVGATKGSGKDKGKGKAKESNGHGTDPFGYIFGATPDDKGEDSKADASSGDACMADGDRPTAPLPRRPTLPSSPMRISLDGRPGMDGMFMPGAYPETPTTQSAPPKRPPMPSSPMRVSLDGAAARPEALERPAVPAADNAADARPPAPPPTRPPARPGASNSSEAVHVLDTSTTGVGPPGYAADTPSVELPAPTQIVADAVASRSPSESTSASGSTSARAPSIRSSDPFSYLAPSQGKGIPAVVRPSPALVASSASGGSTSSTVTSSGSQSSDRTLSSSDSHTRTDTQARVREAWAGAQAQPLYPYAYVTFGAGMRQREVDMFTAANPLPGTTLDGSPGMVPYHVPMAAYPVGSTIMITGGFGFLSRLHGLSIDNLVEAEMVLSDGRVVYVNEDEQPELWWAIRGGGPAFGIVTRYKARAHPVPVVFAGNLIYRFHRATAPSLIRHLRDCVKGAPHELYANLLLTAGPADQDSLVVVQLCYAGTKDAGQPFLDAIASWDGERCLLNEVSEKSFLSQQDSVAQVLRGQAGRKWFIRSTLITSLPDDIINETVLKFADTPIGCTWLFELAGGAISEVQGTCLPKSQRDSAWTIAALHQWDIHIDDPRCKASAEEWIAETIAPVSTGGPYTCFLGRHESDTRVQACFGENWRRLCELKQKYDPENMFSNTFWPPSRESTDRTFPNEPRSPYPD